MSLRAFGGRFVISLWLLRSEDRGAALGGPDAQRIVYMTCLPPGKV